MKKRVIKFGIILMIFLCISLSSKINQIMSYVRLQELLAELGLTASAKN